MMASQRELLILAQLQAETMKLGISKAFLQCLMKSKFSC